MTSLQVHVHEIPVQNVRAQCDRCTSAAFTASTATALAGLFKRMYESLTSLGTPFKYQPNICLINYS